jgi:hypothetical protein
MATQANYLDVVELNVGGVTYATTLGTLQQAEPDSPLATITSLNVSELRTLFGRDSKNRIFIDRDGVLFRYILDYLRNKKLSLPENFAERDRLRLEADYYRLSGLCQALGQHHSHSSPNGKYLHENMNHMIATTNSIDLNSSMGGARPIHPRSNSGCIVVGYRGTFGKLFF